MGLKDAATVFQKAVSATLASCHNTLVFVDDILVYGSTREEHDAALKKVLATLADKQFHFNAAKCEFQVEEVTF